MKYPRSLCLCPWNFKQMWFGLKLQLLFAIRPTRASWCVFIPTANNNNNLFVKWGFPSYLPLQSKTKNETWLSERLLISIPICLFVLKLDWLRMENGRPCDLTMENTVISRVWRRRKRLRAISQFYGSILFPWGIFVEYDSHSKEDVAVLISVLFRISHFQSLKIILVWNIIEIHELVSFGSVKLVEGCKSPEIQLSSWLWYSKNCLWLYVYASTFRRSSFQWMDVFPDTLDKSRSQPHPFIFPKGQTGWKCKIKIKG